jgi:hypothetical protein
MTTTTEEKPLVPIAVALGTALVLGVGGGITMWSVVDEKDFPETGIAPLIPTCLAIVGVLLGAGLGLILADIRTTKTSNSAAATEGLDPNEALKIIKDLTPGKALLVLGVALLAAVLFAIDPTTK